jgi:hypothetical protein
MAAGFEWIIQSLTVPMHLLRENIWDIVAQTGIHTRAVTTVTRTADPVIVTATLVGMTGTRTETPTAVIVVTGVTAAVRHLAVDVTHPITGGAGATREAPPEAAALARITMALLMVPLPPPIMPKMAAVGKALTVVL